MIDPDSLQSAQIQRKLRAKEFILVNNSKATHELCVNDIALVGVLDKDGKEHILDRWAACKHCLVAYRTHSKRDTSQTRNNYGLTSFHAHVKQCRPNTSAITSSTSTTKGGVPKESAPVQTLMSRFAYNKTQLSQQLQSFSALENNRVLDLLQTAIDVGAQMGRVNVRDVFYGRRRFVQRP